MSTDQAQQNSPTTDQPQKKQTRTNDKHQKNEKRQKHQKNEKDDKNEEKKVRHERPAELERNPDLITIDTVLAPLPKKNEIIQKPNLKDYQDKQTKNRERIAKIIEEKKKIFAEKFKSTKVIAKGEGGKHNQFNSQIEQFKDIKERFNEIRTQRNAKRDLLKNLFDQAKENNAELKKLKEQSRNSKENVQDELESLEHQLITSDISKEQQRALQSEITILKRKLREAQPAGNIKVRIEKAEERREELSGEIDRAKEEKQPLEEEYTALKTELDSKNESINKIKGELKNENEQKTQLKEERNKQYEDWKEKKSKRLDELSAKIKAIDEETKNIWKEYKAKNESHWEQKHKLDFLEWQHRVKDAKLRAIQREKRNALYQQKQKEREKEEQLQKYIKEIGICNTLISYLQDISRKDEPEQKQQLRKQPENINVKLDEDSQWKKQKGLIVVQSKKSKEEEEVVKKGGKKNKKKVEKGEQGKVQKFQIPFNVQILFDQIKVLPPDSLEEVENKIGEIKDREALFQRGCKQEVSEDDKQQIEKIAAGTKKQKKVAQKNTEEDFPTL